MAEVTVERVCSAPLNRVVQVARDVESYPRWLEPVQSLKVLDRSEDGRTLLTEWEASLPVVGFKTKWKERDEWEEDWRTCRFYQLEGEFDRYEGVWTFEPDGIGTKMTLKIQYEIKIPFGGPLVEKLVQKIVEQMLQKFLEGIAVTAETGTPARAL